jgi:hypothetical protein
MTRFSCGDFRPGKAIPELDREGYERDSIPGVVLEILKCGVIIE